jgi:hypothetical protein
MSTHTFFSCKAFSPSKREVAETSTPIPEKLGASREPVVRTMLRLLPKKPTKPKSKPLEQFKSLS